MGAVKLVIFDIAGTIIEDHGEVVNAFSAALRNSGIPFSDEELKRWKGASKREVIRHFVEQSYAKGDERELVETTYRCFRDELRRAYEKQLRPIGGAAETFSWCRRHRIAMATTTGFYREISEMILEKTGWRDVFQANISSSDVQRGRPAPDMIIRAMQDTGVKDPEQVVNVGDTPLDLQSGRNAGVRGVVGVLTGEHGREVLEIEPHTHILGSVADLPRLIESEFQK